MRSALDLLQGMVDQKSEYIHVPDPAGGGGVRWHFRAIDPKIAYTSQTNHIAHLGAAPRPLVPHTYPGEPLPENATDEQKAIHADNVAAWEQADAIKQRGGPAVVAKDFDHREQVLTEGIEGISFGTETCKARAADEAEEAAREERGDPKRPTEERHHCTPRCFPRTFSPITLVPSRKDADTKQGKLHVSMIPIELGPQLYEAIVVLSTGGGAMIDRLLSFRGEWSPAPAASLVRGLLDETLDLAGLPGFVASRAHGDVPDRSDLPLEGDGERGPVRAAQHGVPRRSRVVKPAKPSKHPKWKGGSSG